MGSLKKDEKKNWFQKNTSRKLQLGFFAALIVLAIVIISCGWAGNSQDHMFRFTWISTMAIGVIGLGTVLFNYGRHKNTMQHNKTIQAYNKAMKEMEKNHEQDRDTDAKAFQKLVRKIDDLKRIPQNQEDFLAIGDHAEAQQQTIDDQAKTIAELKAKNKRQTDILANRMNLQLGINSNSTNDMI